MLTPKSPKNTPVAPTAFCVNLPTSFTHPRYKVTKVSHWRPPLSLQITPVPLGWQWKYVRAKLSECSWCGSCTSLYMARGVIEKVHGFRGEERVNKTARGLKKRKKKTRKLHYSLPCGVTTPQVWFLMEKSVKKRESEDSLFRHHLSTDFTKNEQLLLLLLVFPNGRCVLYLFI